MARLRLDNYKSLIALAVFLIAWWVFPAIVKSLIKVSFTEFQAPVWIASSYLNDLEEYWLRRSHSKLELIEAGQDIARQKAFYQIQIQQNTSLKAEIERLEGILDLPGRPEFRYEFARVIRRDLSAWWQQIVIRKGRDYNIPKNAPVIFEGGVVGQVVEVNAFTSVVELITSPNFRMAANFDGDDRPVIYQGIAQGSFKTPHGEVRDAPQNLIANSKKPLRIVSTNLGGKFPPGLTIGSVGWLEPGNSGVFQKGEVILDERLLSLHEVTVLIPMNPRILEDEI